MKVLLTCLALTASVLTGAAADRVVAERQAQRAADRNDALTAPRAPRVEREPREREPREESRNEPVRRSDYSSGTSPAVPNRIVKPRLVRPERQTVLIDDARIDRNYLMANPGRVRLASEPTLFVGSTRLDRHATRTTVQESYHRPNQPILERLGEKGGMAIPHGKTYSLTPQEVRGRGHARIAHDVER